MRCDIPAGLLPGRQSNVVQRSSQYPQCVHQDPHTFCHELHAEATAPVIAHLPSFLAACYLQLIRILQIANVRIKIRHSRRYNHKNDLDRYVYKLLIHWILHTWFSSKIYGNVFMAAFTRLTLAVQMCWNHEPVRVPPWDLSKFPLLSQIDESHTSWQEKGRESTWRAGKSTVYHRFSCGL